MKQGFYFFTPKVDYFFVCENLTRTPGKVRKIDEILRSRFNCAYRGQSGRWALKELLSPATIEEKATSWGLKYYDIKGLSYKFSAGSPTNVKRTEVIRL